VKDFKVTIFFNVKSRKWYKIKLVTGDNPPLEKTPPEITPYRKYPSEVTPTLVY